MIFEKECAIVREIEKEQVPAIVPVQLANFLVGSI